MSDPIPLTLEQAHELAFASLTAQGVSPAQASATGRESSTGGRTDSSHAALSPAKRWISAASESTT